MKQTTRCGEPESECRDEVAELKTFYVNKILAIVYNLFIYEPLFRIYSQ